MILLRLLFGKGFEIGTVALITPVFVETIVRRKSYLVYSASDLVYVADDIFQIANLRYFEGHG